MISDEELLEILHTIVKVDEYGITRYYLNGKRHREDGTAIEYASGHREWFLNNQRHRIDGTAIHYQDGTNMWFINGIQFTEEEYWQKVQKNHE